MTSRWFVCATLAAALVAFAPSAARAQTKPAASAGAAGPSAEDKALAKEEYTAGSTLASKSRWNEALPHFLKAWERVKHWQIAASLGKVEVELGKYRAAEQHLSFAQGAADISPGDRANVTKLLERTRASLGTIRIQATAQAPSRVFLDGELIGTTPFTGTTSADPGDHRVEVRFGGKRAGRAVTVASAATAEVSVDLRVPELDKPIEPSAAARPGPSWVGVIALGGVAIVGVGVGAGLWAASEGKGGEAQKLFDALPPLDKGVCTKSACDTVHDAWAAQASLQTGSAVTWVLSGAALAGAAAMFLITRPAPARKTGVELAPLAGPRLGGVIVRGSF